MNETELADWTAKRALISVTDKTSLHTIASSLKRCECHIISSGGTSKYLEEHGFNTRDVASYTGMPELFGGRIKTLHPKIAGGILARRSRDVNEMTEHDIAGIDVVVVNLYRFSEAVESDLDNIEEAIEQIDIGGPTLIRAAAKNYQDVLVVVDPEDYHEVADRLDTHRLDLEFRRLMAAKAFRYVARYDSAIATYFTESNFPEELHLSYTLHKALRYGENPHQSAAFYLAKPNAKGTLADMVQFQGKQLSYNNIADTDAALTCVNAFQDPACVIVKHGNPCGVALGISPIEAYSDAFRTDPNSAFGGVIAFNRSIDGRVIERVIENQFAEIVVAPEMEPSATSAAKERKNLRLLSVGYRDASRTQQTIKQVSGGLLVQSPDVIGDEFKQLKVVTQVEPSQDLMSDLKFAWTVAMYVKSNAIVLARNSATIGIGAGQMNRALSAQIAHFRAREEGLLPGDTVLASDAFFPFRDGIDQAAAAGVKAIIQPGGSIRDDVVIKAANEHDIPMVFTGTRHFRH